MDREALAGNLAAVGRVVGEATEVLAVIKANAYGHGVEACAPVLAAAGARWLGVTCASEGARVRELVGRSVDILIMCGFLREDVIAIVEARLVPVVWTPEHVEWLAGTGARVQVEVDTGMGRQGVRVSELAGLLSEISAAGLKLDGVFTHFCSSEVAGSELTLRQQGRFAEAIGLVRAAGLRVGWVHAGNTSAVDNPAGAAGWLVGLAASVGARAMVRTGLGLFGYALPVERSVLRPGLRPVMLWKARVLAVRGLEVGETVGYNATFTAERRMRVALVPVGYADGLRRELSGCRQDGRADGTGGWMMVTGQRAAILGRISMNLTVVDVTDIDGVAAGDEVVVLGPGISAEAHARLAGTFAYEIVCGVHPCG